MWIAWRWSLRLVGAGLLLAGGSPQEMSGQPLNTGPLPPPDASLAAAEEGMADPETAAEAQTRDSGLAGAAVKPISTEKPLPANIRLTGPVAEVIKLADSGVAESVITAFVTNTPSPFNLGVEEIIYLNDIGVPGLVVNAMMRRDQALKGLSAN